MRLRHLIVLVLSAACAPAATTLPPANVTVRSAPFDPNIDDYFDAPWPDDRRLDDGALRTRDFPNPKDGPAFSTTLRPAAALVQGWGLAAPLYVTLSAAIDARTLPDDPDDALETDAPVQLIDLDAKARRPLTTRFHNGGNLFLPANTLAVRPVPGRQLKPAHRHALVITRSLEDTDGLGAGPDEHLRAVLENRANEADSEHFAAALATLSELGITRESIAGLVVFTTQSIEDELFELKDALLATAAPTVTNLTRVAESDLFDVYDGTYVAPNFMHGAPPYETSGGELRRDAAGKLTVGVQETMRLKACVPAGAVPGGGFPVILYSHGTGGSFHSVVGDKTCELFTARGIAVFATDQVLSGPRAPANATCLGNDVEVCFFNVVNAVAGRNLLRQSALDQLSLRRALASFSLASNVDRFGRTVTLDLTDAGFVGHSQGALTGSLSVPLDDAISYALLSSTGGHLGTTLLDRSDPAIKPLLESAAFLGLAGAESLDPFHPAVALLQTLAEAVDPLNYAPLWNERPVGRAKHVVMVNGWQDELTPITTGEYEAISGRLPPRRTGFRGQASFARAGLVPFDGKASLNIATGDAERPRVTGALWQLEKHGHFGYFDSPVTRTGVLGFFTSAFATGRPELPAIDGEP